MLPDILDMADMNNLSFLTISNSFEINIFLFFNIEFHIPEFFPHSILHHMVKQQLPLAASLEILL